MGSDLEVGTETDRAANQEKHVDNLPKYIGNITAALGFRHFTFMVRDVYAAAAGLTTYGANIAIHLSILVRLLES